MILRSLRLEGLGCFADPVAIGPFTPGVNILHAPNGTGKTTLFRSVGLGLLEGHRSKTAELQALRPWGYRLTPQVSLEFEHSERGYRLRKRFLDTASTHLERRQGDVWTAFAQGDSADDFLRELLLSDSDRARFTKQESWGLAQVLWATQGELILPKFAPKVIEYIHASIGAQIAVQDSGIEARIENEYLKYFSPTRGKLKSGKDAAPQLRHASERDRLVGEKQTAEDLLRQFEMTSSAVEQMRRGLAALFSKKQALALEQNKLRQSVEQYRILESQKKERSARRDAAQSKQKVLRDRIEAIQGCRRQVSEFESALARTAEMLPSHRANVNGLLGSLSEAERVLAAAVEAEEQARGAALVAQDAQEYVRLLDDRSTLSERLKRIAEAQAQIAAARAKKAGIVAPSDAEVRQLRDLLERETDLRRQLELARVTSAFVPSQDLELTVLVGEKPGDLACPSGSTISLAGAPNLSFVITGVGHFDVNGPVTNYNQIERDLEQERLALSALSRQFDTTDLEILEARRQAHALLNSEIQQAGKALSELLAGQTEAAIRNNYAELANRSDQIKATDPAWGESLPDAAALTNHANQYMASARSERNSAEIAERTARLALSTAEIELGNLEATQKAQEEGLQNSKNMLAQRLLDGVTDQQRHTDLDDAVLEYDSCRLALEEAETKLRAFPEDPTTALDRIEKELASVEHSLKQAERTLLQTETNLSGLMDRHPYGQLAEISEHLSAVESELNREKCHTDAIALLRNTLIEVKAEMMKTIAAPVEKAATQYLEQICARPLAEIRLTHSLAAENVAPIQLSDCPDNLVELDRLSGGEREQVFLCTRLALAAELARKERQMVVLDDVLTCTDGERLPRICDLLGQLADRLQIILLTCHPERFDRLTGANRIDLRELLPSGRRAAA
jgi:regulator of replication initiation timing